MHPEDGKQNKYSLQQSFFSATAVFYNIESSSGLWTTRDDVYTQLRLLSMGRLDYKQLIDEVHSPFDARIVYDRLANDKHFPIVQFDWSKI